MVGQLLKPTMRISNRDATKNFLVGWHPDFSLALCQQLRAIAREGMTSYKKASLEWEAEPLDKGKPFVLSKVDNDNKYVWIDVIEIATVLCEEESRSYYELEPYPEDKKRAAVMMQGSEGEPKDLLKQLADKVDKLESSRAKDDTNLKETLMEDIMSSLEEVLTGHMDKFKADQHREMQKLQMAVENHSTLSSNPAPNHTYPNPVSTFARNRAAPAGSDNCFYCYRGGHFIAQSDNRKADLEKGIIHLTNGRLMFFDGKIVPHEPAHKSLQEKAHDHYNHRAISQNYDEIMDTYFGMEEDTNSGSASTQLNQDDVQSMMATINCLEQSFVQARAGGPAENASGFS
jgi:hypothetical protein